MEKGACGSGFWLATFALALLSGCGRELNDGSGDAGAVDADVYWALDPEGTDPVTTIRTDTPHVYCIAKLAAATQSSLTFTFASPELKVPSSETLETTRALVDVAGPRVDPLTGGLGSEATRVCDGYCIPNGLGCQNGYSDERVNSCGTGATCCYNALARNHYPYPVGTLRCTVDAGNARAGTANLVVTYPPEVDGQTCPTPPPVDSGLFEVNGICAGWVPDGAMCDGCTCEENYWSCSP
jgi:hypothetical protein